MAGLRHFRLVAGVAVVLATAFCSQAAPPKPGSALLEVGYATPGVLAAADLTVVRTVPALHVAEVRAPLDTLAELRGTPGIRFAQPARPRALAGDGSPLAAAAGADEWQLHATHEDLVPAAVLEAAASIRIAVVDTGADLRAPVLAAKEPAGYDVMTNRPGVSDPNGHGSFVASLAAGSVAAGNRMAGFGGQARLLVVRAGSGPGDGTFTDVDEAAGIVYAVDHGARIVNLSIGGTTSSPIEKAAIRYAIRKGVLLVAPAGNDYASGSPVEYPAALLQPVGSNGAGGSGLVVGASTETGERAPFSNVGSTVSLAAPGVNVLGAISPLSSPSSYPRAISTARPAQALYGYASGTSFSAPEVSGAAALVWAADPALSAQQVAAILKVTASGAGSWNPDLGYGVIDVAAAVARAQALAAQRS